MNICYLKVQMATEKTLGLVHLHFTTGIGTVMVLVLSFRHNTIKMAVAGQT